MLQKGYREPGLQAIYILEAIKDMLLSLKLYIYSLWAGGLSVSVKTRPSIS